MTVKNNKINLPFRIITSEVSGGFIDSVHNEFTGGINIVNYHEEKYGNFEENSVQSPFTQQWVGGYPHRHVELNSGYDNSSNRKEAWHLEFDPSGVKFYSHKYKNSPPSYWSRDNLAKSPINIKNIKTVTGSLNIGNFSHNYEVVQTSGRRITNNLIVDGFIADGELTTQFITGSHNYSLPVLNSTTGSKSIIVEKFNAPGSKEESSRGSLDREGEEMSPNISLPWRNYKIRKPFYGQLSQSTPKGGGTIHGVHRNTVTRAGNSIVDNGFIVRSLPGTDIQYSWITSSTSLTAQEMGGYQSFTPTDDGSAYTDIVFNTGSLVVNNLDQEYIIDNIGINSLVKDKKTIDVYTNSFSIDPSLSASFSEYTNSPYGFGVWTSLRNFENPVIIKQRKQNIFTLKEPAVSKQISLQNTKSITIKSKRSGKIRSYSEPSVTFKYKPLEHNFYLRNAEENIGYKFVHTYTNNLSTFSNKSLVDYLDSTEEKEQFYDILYSFYTDTANQLDNNPIQDYLGHSYKEIVWPREENTGLSRIRKREVYIFDQPGFDRDGYDRQLGTQRVFWRDNQEDRKRSKNSEGGYYNSMNYLSTEETGSSFSQLREGVLSNNKPIMFDSSFVTSSNIRDGIFNSFALLETDSSERELFYYTSSVVSLFQDSIEQKNIIYNSIIKRGYIYDATGEFGNLFTDFYEQVNDFSTNYKKSIGSMYRNTSYKSLLTELPEERDVYEDYATQTEDDEIFINPKLKYISFVGGGELNTGSFVQDSNNFTDILSGSIPFINGEIRTMLLSGSDIYIGGGFTTIEGNEVNYIAYWDGERWNSVGNGLDNTVYSLILSGSDIYAGGNFTGKVSRWDGSNWNIVGGGVPGKIHSLLLSGSDIYAAGSNTGGGPQRWDGNSWNLTDTISSTVYTLILSGSDVYAGGAFSGRVKLWDGSTWNTVGTGTGMPSAVYSLVSSGSHIYAGGSGSPKCVRWDGSNWISAGYFLSGVIYSLFLSGSDVYAAGNFWDSTKQNIAKLTIVPFFGTDTYSWEQLGSSTNAVINSLLLSGSDIYVAGAFSLTGSKICYWDGSNYNSLFKNKEYDKFAKDYFNQSFSKQEFLFSTLDNGLLRTTEKYSGNKPFFDSYEKFIEDVRGHSKDFSTIPEFKMSEHIDYYIKDKNLNFRAINREFLSLDGHTIYKSSTDKESTYNISFLDTYVQSDNLKKNSDIEQENLSLSELETVTIKVSGIKKLLPYNGFYPQQRITQIANLYKDYVDNNLHGGYYSLSYRNDFFNEKTVETDTTPSSISVEKYNNKYFMASSYPNVRQGAGSIEIFSSSVDDPTIWSTDSIYRYDFVKHPSYNSAYGRKVQLVSASNGLNLFVSSDGETNSSDSSGFLWHSFSNDGISWSTPEKLEVSSLPGIYISGSSPSSWFGHYFDHFLERGQQEKIIFAIGSWSADTSTVQNAGEVYVVTGTLEQERWLWSDKKLIHVGSQLNNNLGTGVSIISCSSGYQVYCGELYGDAESTDYGDIFVIESSDGDVWSSPKRIASGENTYSNIGRNDIKAVNFNNKSYVFFSEPGSHFQGVASEGAVYVITSSENNAWPDISLINKKLLYKRDIANDKALQNANTFSIEAVSGSDGRLYYSFANSVAVGGTDFQQSGVDPPNLIIGSVGSDDNYQDYQNNDYYSYDVYTEGGAFSTITAATYNIDGFSLPIFFTTQAELEGSDLKTFVRAIKNNVFTDYTLKVSGVEKYYKHAALEPFMAPGILYNTIKSGIAVDWPCATGSNTAIVPYGDNTIVNVYYPQAFEMESFSGSNIYESLYGQLRSNIDYRIPFENIIFPGEAFPVKDFLAEDLVRKTVLTTLPDNDPLVKFINGTYIYGGYEPYISPVDFSDINNLGPKRFSVPFVYRKAGSQDSGLYSLAMSNFLAETVKFFLKDEKMTTFVSDPDYKWKEFNSDKTYYMDIVLEKTPDLVMMEAYHSELHPTGSNGEKMNGRYFGYPVNKTEKALWGGATFTKEESKLIHNDPAYAPYTPPYFEGVARARISFKPDTNRSYGLQEIFDQSSVENIFVDIEKGALTGSDAYVNAMPIQSSIDIFGAAQAVEVTIDESTGRQTVRELQDSQNWIISPRMETPVLDFSSQELTPYENNYSKTGGFGRGMWSGYGQIPSDGKGIKMRLEYPYTTIQSPFTASLLEQINLKSEERQIGQLADKKRIEEAIVVIPYLETEDENYTVQNETGFHFIKIEKDIFDMQNDNISRSLPAVDQSTTNTSISKMIEKMKKYIIPPQMNFMIYEDIDPFVMYIFEFYDLLDKQDLADIWQGLMPKISINAKLQDVEISHPSGPNEFFGGKRLPENLRWMIFKVKRKAEYDYFSATSTTKDDERFNFNKIIGRQEGTDIYSYNWPYDFFSLVELAKVELSVHYKKKEEDSN